MSTTPASLVTRRLSAVVPKQMRTLQKDARGYPVPYIVLIDASGTPQFTINNHEKVMECLKKKLCAICGKRIHDGFWFVGGSRSFLHENGAFLDPPLHLECAEYALKVCPFLAARRYTDRIDDKRLDPRYAPDGLTLVKVDYALPALPERFGLGLTAAFRVVIRSPFEMFIQPGPWAYVEWWRAGERCPAPDTGLSPAIPA